MSVDLPSILDARTPGLAIEADYTSKQISKHYPLRHLVRSLLNQRTFFIHGVYLARSFDTRAATPAKMADTLDQRTDDYHPKDALGHAVKAVAITGGAGLFISTIQNTLTKQNTGAWGVFTRSGSTIGIFGRLEKETEA